MVLIVPKRRKGKKVKCDWCGKFFIKKSNAQKYCSDKCRNEGKLEAHRKAQNKYRKRYGRKELGSPYVEVNGKMKPIYLGSTRNPDPKREAEIVSNSVKFIRNYKKSTRQEIMSLEMY